MALDSTLFPSGNFDLRNWKITLPIDSLGRFTGTAKEVLNLTSYSNPDYFFTGNDGSMVFRAPVDGAATSGSSYARTELREMNGTSRAAWNLTTGGVMTATLEVDQVPVRFDGSLGKIVVGQIHGVNDELVRLYWDSNKVYFVNDLSGPSNTENKFYFYNSMGQQPDISQDERFAYVIDAKGSALEVSVYADGDIYRSVSAINSVWQSDSFYFKAGAYLGVNETQGTGWGQASFYDLRFNHTDTALTPADIQLTATLPAVPGKTVTGTDGANKLSGGEGNDVINAKRGNDSVYGMGGEDTIRGGTGTDFLYGGAGSDLLYGEDGWDTLIGGSGADRLSGGAGGDIFKFVAIGDSKAGSVDTIMDWSALQKDKISVRDIDANTAIDGDQAFKFIGTAGFSHSAGEMRYFQSGGHTFIEGDVGGDGIGDLLIMVTASTSFVSGDFVL